jgi:hypothetical protein
MPTALDEEVQTITREELIRKGAKPCEGIGCLEFEGDIYEVAGFKYEKDNDGIVRNVDFTHYARRTSC